MSTRLRAGCLLAAGLLGLAGCTATDTPAKDAEANWSVPCPVPAAKATPAEDFTDLTLPCLSSDKDYPIGAIDTRPRIITLWASWCQPCAKEAPQIQEAAEKLGDQVDIIGVNTQDTKKRARFFAEDFDWTFPSVFDEHGTVMHSQGLAGLPATFVLAPDGSTVDSFTGGDLTSEQLIDTVNTVLGEAP